MSNSNFIRVFSSDKRSSGSHANPLFKNFKPFNLYKGDKVKFSWTIPLIDNIVSPHNIITADLQNLGNYTTITIDEGRYSSVNEIHDQVYKKTTGRLRLSYNKIIDKISISSPLGFTLRVQKDDLMNYLGFPVGDQIVQNNTSVYGTSNPDIFPDNIFIQSNLADYIEDGDYSQNRESEFYPNRICDVIKLYSANNRTLVYDNNLEYTIKENMTNQNEIWFKLLDAHSRQLMIWNQMSCTIHVIGKNERQN